MEKNIKDVTIAKRPQAGVHNSMGHMPDVHHIRIWIKWQIKDTTHKLHTQSTGVASRYERIPIKWKWLPK